EQTSACTDVLWIGKPLSSRFSPASERHLKKARGNAYWKLRSRSRPPVRRWSERGVVLYPGPAPAARASFFAMFVMRRIRVGLYRKSPRVRRPGGFCGSFPVQQPYLWSTEDI